MRCDLFFFPFVLSDLFTLSGFICSRAMRIPARCQWLLCAFAHLLFFTCLHSGGSAAFAPARVQNRAGARRERPSYQGACLIHSFSFDPSKCMIPFVSWFPHQHLLVAVVLIILDFSSSVFKLILLVLALRLLVLSCNYRVKDLVVTSCRRFCPSPRQAA